MCRYFLNQIGSVYILRRMLVVSFDTYPPFRVDVKDLFGVELCKRDYQIDWILQSCDDLEEPKQVEWACGTVAVGATNNGGRWYQRLHKHLLGIRNDTKLFTIDLDDYDLLQVKDKFIAALFAILVTRQKTTKFVYWLSYPIPESSLYAVQTGTARYPLYNLIRGYVQKFLLYKVIMPRADHIFVQSDQMRNDIADEGIELGKMTPVPMGISDQKLPALTDEVFNAEDDKIIILYLGTLMRVRRMNFLVRVFSRVKQVCCDAELYYVGDGEDDQDREEIIEERKRCGLDENDVKITGFLPIEEAWRYVARASVCVSPFYPTPILNSTSPTKLIEYMSFAKPVVANDHPEQRRIITESGAGYCVRYNEEEFADAIIKVIQDKDAASEMGLKGRRYVEEHRVYSKIADIVDMRYQMIIDGEVPG